MPAAAIAALDVFARAQPLADAAKPFAIATGGRTPRIVSANAAAHAAGIRPEQLVSASLALAPRSRVARPRPRRRGRRARRRGHVGDAVHARRQLSRRPTRCSSRSAAACGSSAAFRSSQRDFPPACATWAMRHGSRLRLRQPRRCFSRAPMKRQRRLEFSHGCIVSRRLCAKIEAGPSFHRGARALAARAHRCRSRRSSRRSPPQASPRSDRRARCRALRWRGASARTSSLSSTARAASSPIPRPPFVPPPHYAGKIELPAPVESVEALAFAVNRLVHELSGWLTGRGLGVIEIDARARARTLRRREDRRPRHPRSLRARRAGSRARASHRGAARAARARRAAGIRRDDHAHER